MSKGTRGLYGAGIGLIVGLVAIVWPGHAVAQEQALRDPLLDRLVGHWVMRGTIAGQATTHDVDVDWVLGHGYARLHEVSRERNPDRSPVYEAIVIIGVDPKEPGYACLWLDNTGSTGLTGDAFGHAGPAEGDSLAFLFKDPEGGVFHTTFVYERATDRWRWAMDAEGAGGALHPFARLTLSRRQESS